MQSGRPIGGMILDIINGVQDSAQGQDRAAIAHEVIWTLKLIDKVTGNVSQFETLTVRAWGSEISQDSQYVLTDAFSGTKAVNDNAMFATANDSRAGARDTKWPARLNRSLSREGFAVEPCFRR